MEFYDAGTSLAKLLSVVFHSNIQLFAKRLAHSSAQRDSRFSLALGDNTSGHPYISDGTVPEGAALCTEGPRAQAKRTKSGAPVGTAKITQDCSSDRSLSEAQVRKRRTCRSPVRENLGDRLPPLSFAETHGGKAPSTTLPALAVPLKRRKPQSPCRFLLVPSW
ncbi:hypothetical protein HPB48_001500 [Haemaphysalis longicornis]|uniref:Uncharacterized protein n=1 Tax=Haemaphysalis longicornis TaxID=44386 RepID=A0A9J6FFY9_HAELO|nr:hypothetical protein HPB48_001500 [Haemaphysalis longicornis]